MFFSLSEYTTPFKLRHKGIMGMNKRNHSYIGRYNDRSKFPLVDDKLKTKLIAQRAGCTVPQLIGVISNQGDPRYGQRVAGLRHQAGSWQWW